MDDGPDGYVPRLIDGLLNELLEQLPGLMVVGPRAVGKTTTLARRAATVIRLDREDEAFSFRADPDAAFRELEEPILLDEWQLVPQVLAATKRAIDDGQGANRFYLSGSAVAEWGGNLYPGTGRIQRLTLYPMSVLELRRATGGKTFLDHLASGIQLPSPADPPDIRGYVEMALMSGFPAAAMEFSGNVRQSWLANYVESLVVHDVELSGGPGAGRDTDPDRVRRYFEACSLNTAGVADHRRIYEAASVSKQAGENYERLLRRLMVIDHLPAWTSNRFKRLIRRPKRYVVDPALVAAALRVDAAGIMSDGNLLGRIIDTFVLAQLRPEVAVSASRPRLHHLRTQAGRQEIDLVIELGGGRVIGVEIKAGAAPTRTDSRHLAWLRDHLGDRFVSGVVLHTGPRVFPLEEKITAAPIASIWS